MWMTCFNPFFWLQTGCENMRRMQELWFSLFYLAACKREMGK